MGKWTRVPAAAAVALTLFSTGCATKAQLRRGLETQSEAIEAQRKALEAERAERLAHDQRLTAQDQQLAAELGTLNSDLALLQSDYGVRIAQLEEGMQFAVPVHFAFDEAAVNEGVRPTLERFAQLVQRHYPGAMITVEGFADPAGSAAYNRALSEKRAKAVRESLVALGVPAQQLRAVGYGEERQIVPGAAGETSGAELNRRVVFVVESADVAMGSPMPGVPAR